MPFIYILKYHDSEPSSKKRRFM